MAIRYKIDVLAELKEKGYTTYSLQKNKLLNQDIIQRLRIKKELSWRNLSKICELLQCQPGDILEYVPDEIDIDKLFEDT